MWLRYILTLFWVVLTIFLIVVGKWVYEYKFYNPCYSEQLTRKPQFRLENTPTIHDQLLSKPTIHDQLLDEGNTLKKQQDFQGAISFYKEVLKQDPENQDVRVSLGFSLFFIDKKEDAKEQFEMVLKKNPDNSDALEGLKRVNAALAKEASEKLEKIEAPITRLPFTEQEIENLKVLEHITENQLDIMLIDQEIADFLEGCESELTAKDWYHLALLYIQKRDLERAKSALSIALEINPEFLNAELQLGYILLWQDLLFPSTDAFLKAVELDLLDNKAMAGLEKVANRFMQVEKPYEALNIYEWLSSKDPSNPDYLFYQGRAYYTLGQLCRAKSFLIEVLQIAPQYEDAVEILGNIYIREEHYNAAIFLFSQYQSTNAGRIGLARIAMIKNNPEVAESLYRDVLSENIGHVEARKGLIKSLIPQRRFCEAKRELRIVAFDPNNQDDVYFRDSFEVKSHTNDAFFVDGFYTDSKESDPSIKRPVVKTYYFLSSINFLFPVTDHFRVDLKSFVYHQRENKILAPTAVNYNVYYTGGAFSTRYLFSKFWNWDVTVRAYHASDFGKVAFPFNDTSSVEPGTVLKYDSPRELFAVAGFYDSLVIKNFSTVRSQLLRMANLTGTYGYRFIDQPLHPEFYGFATQTFIHDPLHNQRHTGALQGQFDLPCVGNYFTASYLAEFRAYNKLSPNYYSYKRQWRQTAGLKFHTFFLTNGYFSVLYEHTWQSTRDLFLPIGDTVFVAARQFLYENKVSVVLAYRFCDTYRVEIGGHYFRTSLPYNDWNINGNFLWEF